MIPFWRVRVSGKRPAPFMTRLPRGVREFLQSRACALSHCSIGKWKGVQDVIPTRTGNRGVHFKEVNQTCSWHGVYGLTMDRKNLRFSVKLAQIGRAHV